MNEHVHPVFADALRAFAPAPVTAEEQARIDADINNTLHNVELREARALLMQIRHARD